MLTVIWVAFGIWLSDDWRADIDAQLGPVAAWVIPILLAYLPGLIIGLLCATLLLTRHVPPTMQPPLGPWSQGRWPALTVLIAAHDEEDTIAQVLEHVAACTYSGEVRVVLADDGSTDATAYVAASAARRLGLNFRRSHVEARGKHVALNAALDGVITELVLTVDADTLLHPQALDHIVARVTSRPHGKHICACAGSLLPQNGTRNVLTRMQRWDYRLAINAIKRMQASYGSVLVAQGAFSAYWTRDVRAVGGWPDSIAEDIVLTWSLLETRGHTEFEPLAFAHTVVPTGLRHLLGQRARWARGMIEALQMHPPLRQPRGLVKVTAGIDYFVPLLDLGYVFLWLPGAVLFILGQPLLFGWWSLLVFPLTLLVYGGLHWWQNRTVFRPLGLEVKHDFVGFLLYVGIYQILVSSASLVGYARHILGARRRWRH